MFHVEHSEQFAEFFMGGLAQLGFSLTDTQLYDFIYYYKELIEWNKKINLTSITQGKEIAVKHFLDSQPTKSVKGGQAGDPRRPLSAVPRGRVFAPLK